MTCNAAGPRCYKVDRSTVKALARILNSRGITCQVLTNRLRFLSAEGERAARTLGHTPRMAHAELKVGASRRWRVA
jgi:hypothetical protein